MEAMIAYFSVWAVVATLVQGDNHVFAFGHAVFTIGVVFINIKLLFLDVHHKTGIILGALFITIGGWFAYNLLYSAVAPVVLKEMMVHDGFIHIFGAQLWWWASVGLGLTAVIGLELVLKAFTRVYYPTDAEQWQEIEKAGNVKQVLKEHAAWRGETATGVAELDHPQSRDGAKGGGRGTTSISVRPSIDWARV